MSERDIFTAARAMTDPMARSTYLDGACGGDVALKSRIEGLLRAHDQPDSLLDNPSLTPHNLTSGSTRTISNESAAAASDDEALAILAPPTRPDALGRIGHYEVLHVLGRGAFGIVYRAFDDVLQRVVAVKVMAPQLAATSPARKRFLREARSSAQVRHENVVHVYEVVEHPLPYLAMEFIPGETLQQRLDRVGPLDVPETLRIGRQIAEGLAAAHATDLIHRDIKPSNILIEGGQQKAKLTDFGLARAADDASISQSGIIAGTPMYMAPEQAKGEKLDQRADLFSLGSVLYQMAAGRPPFRANSTVAVLKRVAEDAPRDIREIIPETPQWLCNIIAKLHAKNPDDRYQSAREVADVLADCEAQLKANSRLKDFSRIPRGKAQPSGRRKWVAAAVVLLLPMIALAVTEFAGVTHLFRQQATRDPIKQGSESTPVEIAKQESPDAQGWVKLFNGKDLTGLSTGQPDKWLVQDGLLVGTGAPAFLRLAHDVHDFHLHVEAKVVARGNSTIDFRYYANLTAQACLESDAPNRRAGALAIYDGRSSRSIVPQSKVPSSQDGWFVMDVITVGKKVTIKVDGITTAESTVEQLADRGNIQLAITKGGTIMQFRKIELKKLPPTQLATGRFALSFDGKSSVVNIPSLRINEDHALTVEAWTVLEQPTEQPEPYDLVGNPSASGFVLNGSDSGRNGFVIRLKNPDSYVRAFEKQPVPRHQLVHLAGVYDGKAEIRFYVDGQLQSRMPAPDIKPSTSYLTLGNNRDRTAGFLGRMRDVRLSKVARYDADFTPAKSWEPDADTIALYRFDEGEGAVLKDASGNGHHGQIDGAAWVKADGSPISPPTATPLPPTYKNSLGMEFVLVPKGKSWLGGGKDKLGDKEVEIPADFYLGKYEVTQEEWTKVMGENPSFFSRTGDGKDAVKHIPNADLKRFPVEYVSWDQCQEFVAKLNLREKELGWAYRLPSEREWEYACRAGTNSKYHFGDDESDLGNFAWYESNSSKRAHPVGEKKPNAFGLFDMHGNVFEWTDPRTAKPNDLKVMHRGGAFANPADHCEVSRVFASGSARGFSNVGLRLARVPSGAPSPEATTPLAVAPFTDADVQRIAALPAAGQVEEVRKELVRRNPGFDGKVGHKIEDGVVTELRINTDKVTDVSPIRVFNALRVLECRGTWTNKPNGILADVSSLAGMNLAGLKHLDLDSTMVPDAGLALFKDCKDLSFLRLNGNRQVTDTSLAYFKDCKALKQLSVAGTNVGDAGLIHFKDCTALARLHIHWTKATDAGLASFKGKPLTSLWIFGTGITDLTPLEGMPLEDVHLTPKNITKGLDILRAMKSLKSIGIEWDQAWPAAEFWERYDKGEFK